MKTTTVEKKKFLNSSDTAEVTHRLWLLVKTPAASDPESAAANSTHSQSAWLRIKNRSTRTTNKAGFKITPDNPLNEYLKYPKFITDKFWHRRQKSTKFYIL